jgi:short-chain 2-methylacyl-CoA dehydrogenase
MTVELNDADSAFVTLCKEFAAEQIAPQVESYIAERRCPTELLRHMGKLGLLGPLIPEEYGGANLSTKGFVSALQELGRVDQSLAAAWQAHCSIGSLPLLAFGTEAQKTRWLTPLAAGEQLGAFGLTEPGAGSDAAAITTTARQLGDDRWSISGQKMFISNAGTDMSYGVVILVKIQGGAGAKQRYANFVIENETEGYTLGAKLDGIGWKGLDTRPLYFDEVDVDDQHRLGTAGSGLAQFLNVLETGRIAVAALSVSLTAAVLDLALDYAKQRVQFGMPIAKHQAIQFKLADIATELEAARLLTFRAADLRDRGLSFRAEAAMAKLKASRVAMWAASEAVQIFGGYGYMMESPVARFFCDAKILEIGEGSNEIQHLVIARSLGC